MWNFQMILFASLSLASFTNGINVNEANPKGFQKVKEGDPITLQCKSNDYYYFCDFTNQKTTFQYSLDPDVYNADTEYKVRNLNTGINKRRANWLGDFYQYKKNGCKIQIKSATLHDAGSWSCILEEWENTPQVKGTEDIGTIDDFVNIEITSDFKLIGDELTDPLDVNEGDDVDLQCQANQMYESCSFIHSRSGKKCELSFKPNAKRGEEKFDIDCNDLQQKIVFTDSSKSKDSKTCTITLKKFTKKDAGQWKCNLEMY